MATIPDRCSTAEANSYLAKPGETPVNVFVATCATSGGFIHMYTALDQNLFAKYVIAATAVSDIVQTMQMHSPESAA